MSKTIQEGRLVTSDPLSLRGGECCWVEDYDPERHEYAVRLVPSEPPDGELAPHCVAYQLVCVGRDLVLPAAIGKGPGPWVWRQVAEQTRAVLVEACLHMGGPGVWHGLLFCSPAEAEKRKAEIGAGEAARVASPDKAHEAARELLVSLRDALRANAARLRAQAEAEKASGNGSGS